MGTQNGPIPTTLTLLSDLPKFLPGAKVRFLGCVTEYSTRTAILSLEHNYPPGNLRKAMVDVKLVVSNMRSNETRIGEWVNVMGYIEPQLSQRRPREDCSCIRVQAVLLWSSGPFNREIYETSLSMKNANEAARS